LSEADDPSCYVEALFRESTLRVIANHNASIPLYHVHAFHLVHTPLEVPKSYLSKMDSLLAAAGGVPFDDTSRRIYHSMVLYLDTAVGAIIEAIKAKGMWDNTIVVFSSDNGGPIYIPGGANNHPLRGAKYSDFEGGIRTTALVSGGFVPEGVRGRRHQGVVSIADWYATFSYLAGVSSFDPMSHSAGLPPVDGIEQWSAIVNQSDARAGRALHLSPNALLQWPYKLITGHQPYSSHRTGPVYPNCTTSKEFIERGPMFKVPLMSTRVRVRGPMFKVPYIECPQVHEGEAI